MMSEYLFYLFASLAIGGAVGTVLSRSPVSSLLALVLTFFSLAAIYVLLGAHFIGAVQIIVYAGAIMVLFLFVIMLLNLGHDLKSDLRRGGWMIAGFAASGSIGFLLARRFLTEGAGFAALPETAIRASGVNAVDPLAQSLFRDFIVPFELTGLLLLVAVVGAVLIAKRRI